MTERYYQEFSRLKEITLDNIQEVHGTITEAVLRFESSISGAHVLRLVRPRVDALTSVRELFNGMDVEQGDYLKVFGVFDEPCEFGEPSAEIKWRIEIWGSDGLSETVRCREIQGLPERTGKLRK